MSINASFVTIDSSRKIVRLLYSIRMDSSFGFDKTWDGPLYIILGCQVIILKKYRILLSEYLDSFLSLQTV